MVSDLSGRRERSGTRSGQRKSDKSGFPGKQKREKAANQGTDCRVINEQKIGTHGVCVWGKRTDDCGNGI